MGAMADLQGLKVAIQVESGFEEVEPVKPRQALNEAGAETGIVSPKDERVRAGDFTDWSDDYPVDVRFDNARPEDFEVLLLPGGVINPDALRIQPKAVALVQAFFAAGKPVASICHAPWTVIEAGAARGRTVTSWPSLRTDLKNAGADRMDEEVGVDRGLVTSRNPDDIPAFPPSSDRAVQPGAGRGAARRSRPDWRPIGWCRQVKPAPWLRFNLLHPGLLDLGTAREVVR
jgi:protease I